MREREGERTCSCGLEADLKETDKATIDVEAQDDGIMGKILVSSSSPPFFLNGLNVNTNKKGSRWSKQDPSRTSHRDPSGRRR